MRPDPGTEARLFGKLALRGALPREAVAQLFAEVRAAGEGGRAVSLSALALQRGLVEKEQLQRWFRTDGDDVPELPGHAWVRKLGEGGTADVYRVRRQSDGGTEAVKLLKPERAADPVAVRAFVAEAKRLAALDHPNVVKGHRVGRLGARYLFFMEDVDGETLQEKIARGGAFEEDGALYVILQVARALEYLREQGLVHRDIKPGNILVTADNKVKVIDLGFAGTDAGPAGADASGAAPESAATVSGTAAYLSPEQAQGRSDLDVRSDIYSLGATLYQMVLGELPFAGDDAELVQKAVLEGLSAAATKGGRISAPMHYFIEKMMAKDRDIRYQSPHELMADIEDTLAGHKSAAADGQPAAGPEDDDLQRRRLARLRRRRERR